MSILTFIQVDMILENADEHEQRDFFKNLGCYLCVRFLCVFFLGSLKTSISLVTTVLALTVQKKKKQTFSKHSSLKVVPLYNL